MGNEPTQIVYGNLIDIDNEEFKNDNLFSGKNAGYGDLNAYNPTGNDEKDYDDTTFGLGFINAANWNGFDKETRNIEVAHNQLDESGWYYDKQKLNNLTSVKLFANTFRVSVEEGGETKRVWKTTESGKYTYFVMSSVITDDFTVEVNNGWTDMGEDLIGNAINGALKPFSAYGSMIEKGLTEITKSHQEKMKSDKEYADNVNNSTTGKIINWITNKITDSKTGKAGIGKKLLGMVNNIAQGNVVTQGTSFTTYAGSGVSFNNLEMRFTLFPAWVNGKLVSVIDQVSKIVDYAVGDLQPLPEEMKEATKEVAKAVTGTIQKKTNIAIADLANKAIDTGADALNKYLFWQAPPAGYTVNSPMNLDTMNAFPGTFMLAIGSHYIIENLVIANMSLKFSKQLMKNPLYFDAEQENRLSSDENALSPLYCEVSILFKPITKYSNRSLFRFINGKTGYRKEVAGDLLRNLDKMSDYNGVQTDKLNKTRVKEDAPLPDVPGT